MNDESSHYLVFVKHDVDSRETWLSIKKTRILRLLDISPPFRKSFSHLPAIPDCPSFSLPSLPLPFSFPFFSSSFSLLLLSLLTSSLFRAKNQLFLLLPAFRNFWWLWLLTLRPSRYYLLSVNYRSIFLHNSSSFSKNSFPFCHLGMSSVDAITSFCAPS